MKYFTYGTCAIWTGKNITFVDGNFIMKNSNIDVFWGSVEEKYEVNELHPITKRMDSII